MAELTVAMTYASALFAAAEDVDKVEEIKEEAAMIQEIFLKEKDFFLILNNPAVSREKKKELLESVFKDKICDEMLYFLYILIDKGRLHNYEGIGRLYLDAVNKQQGIGMGIIYSAVPLSTAQINEFENQTGKLIKKNVKLTNEVDKTLIGGVKILIEGKSIDASLKGRLKNLVHQIENN